MAIFRVKYKHSTGLLQIIKNKLIPFSKLNRTLIQQSFLFKIYLLPKPPTQSPSYLLYHPPTPFSLIGQLQFPTFYTLFNHIFTKPPPLQYPKTPFYTPNHLSKSRINKLPMNLCPSYHPSNNKTTISQSIQYELTQTHTSTQELEESSSILSLSNYLQQDDSSLCFQPRIKSATTQKLPQKLRMFSEIQCAQRLFIKHLDTEFDYDFVEQESESMLLAYSSIKENKPSQLENSQFLNEDDKNPDKIDTSLKPNSDVQNFPSRISPKNNPMARPICSDSIELIELLSIPKEPSLEFSQQVSQKNYEAISSEQMVKIQQIYRIIQSNKNLFSKLNILEPQTNKNSEKCANCVNLTSKLQNIQSQLTDKQNQIKKYEALIEKLNSSIFDLKIQNKQLFFENKQYSAQIQKILLKKHLTNTIQRVKTVNLEHYEDNSLDEIMKESNGVSSSYANLSRKTTKVSQNCIKNTDSQNMQEVEHTYMLYDKRNYPQTPMPSYSQVKNKKQRRPSNHSDKKLHISISQLREPNIYQIHSTKPDQILKQNNRQTSQLVDKKSQCSHKSQKNIMRFSNLSKQINQHYNGKSPIELVKRPSHQPLSQKSPIKAHGFLKVKNSKLEQNIESLRSHPLNKFSQDDNNSQSSQTKTQKLYGLKKSSSQEPICQFADYNMVSINKNPLNQQKFHRHGPGTSKINEPGEKNSIIYKSFKEIGNIHEHKCMKNGQKETPKNVNVPFGQYGDSLGQKHDDGIYGALRNRQKSERNFLSSLTNSSASKRQSSIKIPETPLSCTQPVQLKLPQKSFLR